MVQDDSAPPYGALGRPPVPGEMVPVSTDAAEAKGLASNGRLNADYAIVQNMYRTILLPRLVSELGLESFDAQLVQGGIPAVPEAEMSFAQYAQTHAGIDLKYVFIRNNFYIERLSQDQIDQFLAHVSDPQFAINPTLNQIVTETYPRVIRLMDLDGDFQTGFGTSGQQFYNDAIVVNLVYTMTSADEDSQERFTDAFRQRMAYVENAIIPELQQTLEQSWPGHISLFCYLA
jgi:hypothetical protein